MAGKGSNSVHLRHYNERVMLDALRRLGQASKAEMARYAHLTPPAVAAIIDALAQGGYVRESGRRFGGKGQPSALYELDPEGAFSIGLHIGRRALDAILIDFSGETIGFERFEYDFPVPANLRQLSNAVLDRFRAQLGPARVGRLVGIGVSAPYFIGGWDHELGFPPEISTAWRSIDLAAGFFETEGLSVAVENDASAAAVAELVQGVGTKYQDFLHITLNTFIGAGLVLNGTLQTGPHGNTAAFAPFPVSASTLNSVPPPTGKFEQLLHRASIYTLLNHLRFNGYPVMRSRELEELPPAAAPIVKEWQNDAADALAQAITGSISVVDVEAVVIDGLLPRPLLLDTVARVRTTFAELLPQGLIAPEIMAGALGSRASALGASLLPIYSMFGPDTGVLSKKALDRKPLMVGSLT
jgi:predicted NBD/HSP70 family sugar kinase